MNKQKLQVSAREPFEKTFVSVFIFGIDIFCNHVFVFNFHFQFVLAEKVLRVNTDSSNTI